MADSKTILAVVGSTKFDDLIRTVSSEEFIKVFLVIFTTHVIQNLL